MMVMGHPGRPAPEGRPVILSPDPSRQPADEPSSSRRPNGPNDGARKRKSDGDDEERVTAPRSEDAPQTPPSSPEQIPDDWIETTKQFFHADGSMYDDVDTCQECGQGFVSRRRLFNHLSEVHGDRVRRESQAEVCERYGRFAR